MRLLPLVLSLAVALTAEVRVRVAETTGLAREKEPVQIELDGREEYIFVTIGANQAREFTLSELRPSDRLEVRYTGPTGFTLDSGVLQADHAARESEDSGSLRGLTYTPFGVTLRRTQNRMHWAPSFQREGERGYTSMATWQPVQRTKRRLGAPDGSSMSVRASTPSIRRSSFGRSIVISPKFRTSSFTP